MFFFIKQKTAYEMRISDWSSDVCSSDLRQVLFHQREAEALGDAAMDLALHQRRVHRAADVVGSGHAQHLHRAEVEIDRHLGDLRGKAVGRIGAALAVGVELCRWRVEGDRKSTRLNSSH